MKRIHIQARGARRDPSWHEELPLDREVKSWSGPRRSPVLLNPTKDRRVM